MPLSSIFHIDPLEHCCSSRTQSRAVSVARNGRRGAKVHDSNGVKVAVRHELKVAVRHDPKENNFAMYKNKTKQ